MKIIIDANILFAALIRDSTIRRLIIESELDFLFPEFVFEEFKKYKPLILKKSGLSEEELEILLSSILKKVSIISTEVILPYKFEAIELLKNIDLKDVQFIACCLAFENSFLWSDDKNLKNQTRVIVINTKEFIEFNNNQE